MKRILTFVIAVFAFAPSIANTAVTIYRSEQEFLASAPIVSTETFDEIAPYTFLSTRMIQIDGVYYDNDKDPWDKTEPWIWGISSPWGSISAPNCLSSRNIMEDRISFGIGEHVKALGFWFLPSGVGYRIPPRYDIIIDETNGQRSYLNFSGVMDWSQYQPYYFGFLSDLGISKITVRDWTEDNEAFNWTYDNVSRSAIVPEPSSLFTLLTGVSSIGGLLQHRRRQSGRSGYATKAASTW